MSVNPFVNPNVNPGKPRLQLVTVAAMTLLAVSHAAKLASIRGTPETVLGTIFGQMAGPCVTLWIHGYQMAIAV